MIENQRDEVATYILYNLRVLTDPKRRSYVSISGHMYLKGPDVKALREKVFAVESQCGICHKALAPGQGDLEHIQGGLGPGRCYCFKTILADGTMHTNVRRTHSMRDIEPCHRKKHNRE